ncbi:MAG: DNA repair protein RecO [Bacteroidota bacterium]
MLHKTLGIVIHYLRYRESSIIVKMYTEEFGLQSYIENNVRSAKARNKIALFQPLTLLDLVVYHRPDGGLTRLSEIRCHTPFSSLPYDFHKASIAMFITEMLSKTLKEESGSPPLFHFLFQSILWLDQAEANFENFHLQFLLQLARFLGFSPQSAEEIFEQLTSAGQSHRGFAGDSSAPEDMLFLDRLIQAEYGESIKVSHFLRREALEHILSFYQLHIENFGEIKSLPVLQEVMR